MVKFIIGLLILVIAVLLAVLAVQKDPGFVLIKYADFSLETSLAFGIVAVVIAGLIIQLLLRLLLALWRLPRTLKKRRERRRFDKARRLSNQGLIDLAEGRFAQAETSLLKLVQYADNPLLNYLAAARAAQLQGKYDQRDNYLKDAHEANPEAVIAIGVTQGELQLASKQTERALATLTHLRTVMPKHDYILKLLVRVYLQLEEWRTLSELLPEVRKKKLFDDAMLREIELKAYAGLLDDTALTDPDTLDKAWAKIPKDYHGNTDLILHYIDVAQHHGQQMRALEQILVKSINQQWDAKAVEFYGRMQVEDTGGQLAIAEKWLQEYGNSDVLLLTLGRICIRLKLWGKAQSYLEASVGARPTAQNCLELADLLTREELGQAEKAGQYYQQGLHLCLKENC